MHGNRIASPFWSLRLTFGLIPIIAGLDKFFNVIVDWQRYLSPTALEALPVSPTVFMYGVGVVEIVAGLLVLSPLVRFGAYLVGAWLLAIAANLVLGGFYDIAVRDVALAVGAFALGQLASAYHPREVARTRREQAPLEPAGAHV